MKFRKMERMDIPAGLSLCRNAGWNQLSRDWEIFLTLDPEGNRVCVDEEGNVVGTVATIRYSHHFAWIGMVLVDPAHQRKGIGLSLLKQAGEILLNEVCVKLDATPVGREVYVKLGFEDEYTLSRMVADTINPQHLSSIEHQPDPYSTTTALTVENLGQVRQFDLTTFGADRSPLLSWMLEGTPELAFKVLERNQLKGYCFGRPGYRYTHIGPVVAENREDAKALVSAALRRCGNKSVILDVPHHDASWLSWLEAAGFSVLRPFIRMYKGTNRNPGVPQNQFAILGPEFG